MNIQLTQKNLQQQKLVTIFPVDAQYRLYGLCNHRKYSLHRGEDCMKHFCSSLREHATDVIKFEKQTKTQNYIHTQQHVTFAKKNS